MERKRKELYEKTMKEKDTIRQIIKLHVLDCLFGNGGRESLDYVDTLYPALEALFGVDNCIASLNDKDLLKNVYNEEFDTNITYDTLLSYFDNAREICTKMNDKDRLLKVCEDTVNMVEKVYNSKKQEKTHVK